MNVCGLTPLHPAGLGLGCSAQVDLNRDFPDPWVGRSGAPSQKDLRAASGLEQPETRALMNLTRLGRFVASAALHEGALVANYPLDGYRDGSQDVRGVKHAAQDDATFVHLARTYARLHTTMSKSKVRTVRVL